MECWCHTYLIYWYHSFGLFGWMLTSTPSCAACCAWWDPFPCGLCIAYHSKPSNRTIHTNNTQFTMIITIATWLSSNALVLSFTNLSAPLSQTHLQPYHQHKHKQPYIRSVSSIKSNFLQSCTGCPVRPAPGTILWTVSVRGTKLHASQMEMVSQYPAVEMKSANAILLTRATYTQQKTAMPVR